jgi:hypothetical protein
MSDNKQLRGDRNQCCVCGEYFNSTHAFEKHRVGDFGVNRRCLTTDEMMTKGMVLGADKFWRGSARPVETISRPYSLDGSPIKVNHE